MKGKPPRDLDKEEESVKLGESRQSESPFQKFEKLASFVFSVPKSGLPKRKARSRRGIKHRSG